MDEEEEEEDERSAMKSGYPEKMLVHYCDHQYLKLENFSS